MANTDQWSPTAKGGLPYFYPRSLLCGCFVLIMVIPLPSAGTQNNPLMVRKQKNGLAFDNKPWITYPRVFISFQDVESSIIMFPFRSKERKKTGKKKEGGAVREKEWRSKGFQTLMVPEWGFVHMVHLALSFIICPQPHNTKNNKRWNTYFSSPYTLVSPFIRVLVPSSTTRAHIPIVNGKQWQINSYNKFLSVKKK